MAKQDDSDAGGRRVKSVDTTCRIIEGLRELDGAGVTELAEHLDLSKATVHSHLATLTDNEFVIKRGDDYKIGLRFVDFGEYAKKDIPVYELAKEQVDRLAEETSEVAQFMVEEHGKGVYLHKSRGENAIQTTSYTGYRKHLHCTALGKAILSQLDDTRIRGVAAKTGLPQRTANTITTVEALVDEVEQIRTDGVAFDDEEILEGMRCVAAPVTHPSGEIYGAISVSGPTSRFKGERFQKELPEIVSGAANIIEVNASQAVQ
jgi:DNA-binding IclR family transcriptional regulator